MMMMMMKMKGVNGEDHHLSHHQIQWGVGTWVGMDMMNNVHSFVQGRQANQIHGTPFLWFGMRMMMWGW